MAEQNRGLPLVAVIVGLLVVLAAGSFYTLQLRADNTALRAEIALSREPAAATSAAKNESAAPLAARALTGTQRDAFIAELRKESGPQRAVWFAYSPNDAESLAYQRSIQSAFEEAGWTVQRSAPSTFPLRPGIYFLMADESPPPHVLTALDAFAAAGLEVSAGRDYRSFHAQKKLENPDWRGFDMEADQPYIVAVGRKPTP